MENISVRLHKDDLEILRGAAEQRGSTVSEIVRGLIRGEQAEIAEVKDQLAGLKESVQSLTQNVESLVAVLLRQEQESQPKIHPKFLMKTLVACKVVMEATIEKNKEAYLLPMKNAWAAAKNEGPQQGQQG